MKKFRFYFDKDKETVWLNEMAAKGYALTGFFAGIYSFEKTEPGEYVYQIDFNDKMFAVSDDYRSFMEETGVEIVQSWGYWVFLRKKAADGDFILYSDVDSLITHYTKIRNMFKVVTLIELICFMIEIISFELTAPASKPMLFCFILLIGTFVFACAKMTFKTNHIIAELKERKGEATNLPKQNGPSPLLISGLLLNSCALIISNPALDHYKIIIQIVAIILMLVGIYQTSRGWKMDC